MGLTFSGRTVDSLAINHEIDIDAHTGRAVLRVPVPMPPGRGGMAPGLTLIHTSTGVNSPYGAGWGLEGLPSIAIRTDEHFPRWDGTDTLQFGGDELVPWLHVDSGAWRPRGFEDGDWLVTFLRSRRGGARVRVEQWHHVPTNRTHFRVRDASGTLTVFGARSAATARIESSDEPARTFIWLPEVQVDPHGNAVWMEYAAETLDGVERSAPHEQRRPSLAQRYLKRVMYGNVEPVELSDDLLQGVRPTVRWSFQTVFDYGDHTNRDRPQAEPDRPWPVRADPYSTCRAGFEVRTYRLCRRILLFHHFPELGAGPSLVGVLKFRHDEQAAGSTLIEIGYSGCRVDTGSIKALPPLRLTYAAPASATAFEPAGLDAQENVPGGLGAARYAFIDLYGDGLPGILVEGDRSWYYKPNLGEGHFGPLTVVGERPSVSAGSYGFTDFDRDGNTEASRLLGRLAGRFDLDRDERQWSGYRPYPALPHAEALTGRAHWADLNGDGLPDLIVTKEDSIAWYASERDGFAAPIEVPLPDDGDAIPTAAVDAALRLFLADMNGDGLADVVRVQNGCVEYWPSLGNGRFGGRRQLDGAPQFAADDEFDPARVRFVDLDGSGTSDIVYVGRGEVSCWTNAAGNRLLAGSVLRGLPYIDNVSSARILDLRADGVSTLVWSSPLPGVESAASLLALTPRDRPRLLLGVDDSRGRETRLTYSSSSAHYLRDQQSGRSWSTALPFHRLVVDRIETIDQIRGTRSARRFEYHDGAFDGHERELRGFGQVDEYNDADVHDAEAEANIPDAVPLRARTWFHLGTPMWHHHRLAGVYAADAELPHLLPHVVEDAEQFATGDLEDGLCALAGAVLRRETYAVDADGPANRHPFEVYQATYRLRRIQPGLGASRTAFDSVLHEELSATYEATAGDPRLMHHVALDVDEFGSVTREATVVYPRREGMPRDVSAQGRQELIVSVDSVQHLDERDRFRLDVPIESRKYALSGLTPAPARVVAVEQLQASDVATALSNPDLGDSDLVDDPAAGPQARLLSDERSYYWDATRTGALALGVVGDVPVAHHEEAACFAPPTVDAIFGNRVDGARLAALGYAFRDGLWWQVDPTILYTDATAFTLPRGVQRSDGSMSTVEYDAHALEVVAEVDPVGNRTTAEIDYHLLEPSRLTDTNGYVREVRYDALGVIALESHRGSVDGQPWGFAALADVNPSAPSTLAGALADAEAFVSSACRAVWYDLDTWRITRQPIVQASFTREELRHDGAGGGTSTGRLAVTIAYTDGLGRPLQVKRSVEPGPAIQRDQSGAVRVDVAGRPLLAEVATRWHVSGHAAFDRHERLVSSHQSFFSASASYEADDVLRRLGVSPIRRYDALGRAIRDDFPNGTFAATRYGVWTIEQSDPNDTVLESAYKTERESLPAADPQRQALDHAVAHAGTTRLVFLDAAGRHVGTLVHGGASGDCRTETRYDLQGRVREVVDPRGLLACSYRHDMSGRLLYERSIDAGESRALPDAANRPALTWTARGFEVEAEYDALDRPLRTHVRGGDGAVLLDHRVQERMYGESVPNGAARNLRGRIVLIRDADGEVTLDSSDPLGSPLASSRRLRTDVSTEPDWRQAVALETDPFVVTVQYDGLRRPIREQFPDGTIRRTEYLAGGGHARVTVTTPDGQLTDVPVLASAEYDERGQRTVATLGNGVDVEHDYDPQTFRPAVARARRGSRVLQECRFTYDPVGNLVRVVDEAQASTTAIVSNAVVDARRDFVYDAHYRLRRATGRVHQALLQHDYAPGAPGALKGTRRLSLNDGGALERYTREYEYDVSGNLQRVKHMGATRSWTTNMWISPASNRSLQAERPDGTPLVDPESHFDAAGNVRAFDHLRRVDWSWRGTLQRAVTIERPGSSDDDERYVYGADGLRTRRIRTRVVSGTAIETTEMLYIGDVERKRIRVGTNVVLERWTLHVSDGQQRVATLSRWTKDDLARETDDISHPRLTYDVSTDRLSCSLRLDEHGDVVSYDEYFPYGATAFAAGDRLREVDWSDVRYSDKERDDATGLYCYGYRYYAPWMCRWLSPDPLGPQDGLNLYQFVRGDPVGRVDPMGLDSEPGKVKYKYIDPPKAATDVESKIANWRTALPKAFRRGFDTLSHDDQLRFATAASGSVYLVPADPDSANAAQGWVVISKQQFESSWLPARIAWAKKAGVPIKLVIATENPARLPGTGGTGGSAPPGQQARPGGQTTSGGGRTGAEKDGASSGGDKGSAAGANQGAGEGQGDKNGSNAGAGVSGKTASGSGDGEARGGGGIRGLEGSGNENGDTYGGIGGLVGGQSWGVVGGTPHSIGHTTGGRGLSPDETGAGSGVGGARGGYGARPGRGGGGSTAAEGGTSARDGTGAGARGTSPAGVGGSSSAAGRPPAGEPSGAKTSSGGKEGGTATREKTGWDAAVEMAGVTNFVFDGEPGQGHDYGIPGGLGLLKLEGRWVQAIYVVTSIVSLILTVTGIPELLAGLVGLIRGLFRLGIKLIAKLPALLRLGLRFLRNLLTKLPSAAEHGMAFAMKVPGIVTKTARGLSEWWHFRRDIGGFAHGFPSRFGFIFRTTIHNPAWAAGRFFGAVDTAAHEGVHWLASRIPWNWAIQRFRPFGQPVFAVLNWAEETIAYAVGHASALRFHAVPFAPYEAFGSVARNYANPYIGGIARRWAIGEVIGIGGVGAYYWLSGDDDDSSKESATTP